MATYVATLISVNNIGNTDIVLREENGAGTLNQLLATTGNEPFIVDSVDLFSVSASQVQQPIEFIRKSVTGNQKNVVKIPTLDRYQLNNTIRGLKTDKFPIDEDTYINYIVEGNTYVRITLNMNKEARDVLSYTKILDQANKSNTLLDVIKDIGFREYDEVKSWDGSPTEDFRELAEVRFFPADGNVVKKQKVFSASSKDGSIVTGLVVLLIGGSFLAFLSGKGKDIFKLKIK